MTRPRTSGRRSAIMADMTVIKVFNPSDTAIHVDGVRVAGRARVELKDSAQLKALVAAGHLVKQNAAANPKPQEDPKP